MGRPVAKKGDKVVGLDTHVVLVPAPGSPVPTPLPFPFSGPLTQALSPTVFLDDAPMATVGSGAQCTPPHIPVAGPFQRAPSNHATIKEGSATVFANDRRVARASDAAECCNDPADTASGHVVAAGTGFAGG